jgi:hypothetical protein
VKQIPVVTDTPEYQRKLKSTHPNRYRPVSDSELKALGLGAHVLTGDKTKDFGGGPSPDGFVVQGGQVLGRIRLVGRRIDRGNLTL